MERVTTLVSPVRQSLTLNRDSLAAAFFVCSARSTSPFRPVRARRARGTFQLSISGSGTQIPNIKVPATLVCYVVGGISVVIGFWRGSLSHRPG